MGIDGDIMISHSPPLFSHTSATTFYNAYAHCRIQNQNNVQRQRLKSPSRVNNKQTFERKPNRPCLIVRPDDCSSSSSSSDENEPLSPIRQKKKVVFADDRGFSLTQIRLMVDSPLEKMPVKTLAQLKIDCETPKPTLWKVMFSQPASNYSDFRKRLEDGNVSLENVIVRNQENELVGTVKVKNICFEKSVLIRSTVDNWTHHEDVECEFVDNNTSSAVTIIYDTFSFKLSLSSEYEMVQFCVLFKSAQGEFWDNNNGKNYTIQRNDEGNQKCANVLSVKNIIENGFSQPAPVRSNTWPSYSNWNASNVGFEGSPYW